MNFSELDTMVDIYISVITENAYHDFFKGMLQKYGVKSPMQLPPDKRKLFFSDVKTGWAKQKGKS